MVYVTRSLTEHDDDDDDDDDVDDSVCNQGFNVMRKVMTVLRYTVNQDLDFAHCNLYFSPAFVF